MIIVIGIFIAVTIVIVTPTMSVNRQADETTSLIKKLKYGGTEFNESRITDIELFQNLKIPDGYTQNYYSDISLYDFWKTSNGIYICVNSIGKKWFIANEIEGEYQLTPIFSFDEYKSSRKESTKDKVSLFISTNRPTYPFVEIVFFDYNIPLSRDAFSESLRCIRDSKKNGMDKMSAILNNIKNEK